MIKIKKICNRNKSFSKVEEIQGKNRKLNLYYPDNYCKAKEKKIVKIDFDKPDEQKEKIMRLIKEGYMAVIHVGPSEISPYTFSKHGHYLVISDIDENNNFYVINSNKIGDNQLDTTYSYETIIQNMFGRKDSFNFLFIKEKSKNANDRSK